MTKQPIINIPFVVLVFAAICVLTFVVTNYLLEGEDFNRFISAYAFIPDRFYHAPTSQLFNTLSYAFLHGSWTHLLINLAFLVVFGSPLAARLGTIRFMLFWFFTAFIAAMAHFCLSPQSSDPLIGASGAITGMMGAATRFNFSVAKVKGEHVYRYHTPPMPIKTVLKTTTNVVFLAILILSNLGLGLIEQVNVINSQPIAWFAHLGGLLAGFFVLPLLNGSHDSAR